MQDSEPILKDQPRSGGENGNSDQEEEAHQSVSIKVSFHFVFVYLYRLGVRGISRNHTPGGGGGGGNESLNLAPWRKVDECCP